MPRHLNTPGQASLLDWQPPQPVARFADDQVRAASLPAKVCRAVAVALKDAPTSRDETAGRMGEFLGERVSPHILNRYASTASEDHVISVARYIALIHATGDRRLLELIAEMFGWAVVERKFLKAIHVAALQEREDELRRERVALAREARAEGAL